LQKQLSLHDREEDQARFLPYSTVVRNIFYIIWVINLLRQIIICKCHRLFIKFIGALLFAKSGITSRSNSLEPVWKCFWRHVTLVDVATALKWSRYCPLKYRGINTVGFNPCGNVWRGKCAYGVGSCRELAYINLSLYSLSTRGCWNEYKTQRSPGTRARARRLLGIATFPCRGWNNETVEIIDRSLRILTNLLPAWPSRIRATFNGEWCFFVLSARPPPLLGANRLHNGMEWVMSYDRKVVSRWNHEGIKLNWNDWKSFEDVSSSAAGLLTEHCMIFGFDHLTQPFSEWNDEKMIIFDSESWSSEILTDSLKRGFPFFSTI